MNVKPASAALARSLVFVFAQFDPAKFLPDDGACPTCSGHGLIDKGLNSRGRHYWVSCLRCHATGWKDGKLRS